MPVCRLHRVPVEPAYLPAFAIAAVDVEVLPNVIQVECSSDSPICVVRVGDATMIAGEERPIGGCIVDFMDNDRVILVDNIARDPRLKLIGKRRKQLAEEVERRRG